MTIYYQIQGSWHPGCPWFDARGARFGTREEAVAAVPGFRVPGVPMGIRVKKIDTASRGVPRRPGITHVTTAAPVLRKGAR